MPVCLGFLAALLSLGSSTGVALAGRLVGGVGFLGMIRTVDAVQGMPATLPPPAALAVGKPIADALPHRLHYPTSCPGLGYLEKSTLSVTSSNCSGFLPQTGQG